MHKFKKRQGAKSPQITSTQITPNNGNNQGLSGSYDSLDK